MAILKLKKEYIGSRFLKGSQVIELHKDLTQIDLLYIKKYINEDSVEVISDDSDKISELRIAQKEAKKYAKDNQESGK